MNHEIVIIEVLKLVNDCLIQFLMAIEYLQLKIRLVKCLYISNFLFNNLWKIYDKIVNS
jgi:hypothetical protein